MNNEQVSYLERYCTNRHISKEEAMTHAIVKNVMEMLETKKGAVEVRPAGDGLSCNCS